MSCALISIFSYLLPWPAELILGKVRDLDKVGDGPGEQIGGVVHGGGEIRVHDTIARKVWKMHQLSKRDKLINLLLTFRHLELPHLLLDGVAGRHVEVLVEAVPPVAEQPKGLDRVCR